MRIIQRLRMPGLLSFPPDMDFFELQSLNVLIGPNASGKSNFIEALGLLSALPTDLSAAVRAGGGASEWLWKGGGPTEAAARMEVETRPTCESETGLAYVLLFSTMGANVRIIYEAVEDVRLGPLTPYAYYSFRQGFPEIKIRVRTPDGQRTERTFGRDDHSLDQSVLAQRKDPDLYPELFSLGMRFGTIQSFREWTFGRYGELRRPQRADLPERWLLPDCSNLALVLNQIEHKSGPTFDKYLRRFFPRFTRMTTMISGGTVQFYLHETDFDTPIPATRLSDGTIRFVALLATLLTPEPPRIVCIEEPELGLHPDAVAMLADLLIEAAERVQLVITTHSDALVSALSCRPDAIVACERPGAGTELRRLDPKKLASWLENYRLGDLWRMGELGANP